MAELQIKNWENGKIKIDKVSKGSSKKIELSDIDLTKGISPFEEVAFNLGSNKYNYEATLEKGYFYIVSLRGDNSKTTETVSGIFYFDPNLSSTTTQVFLSGMQNPQGGANTTYIIAAKSNTGAGLWDNKVIFSAQCGGSNVFNSYEYRIQKLPIYVNLKNVGKMTTE